MFTIQSNDDRSVCMGCFCAKRKCDEREKPCCSKAASNQLLINPSPCIGKDILATGVISKLSARSRALRIALSSTATSVYVLECSPIPSLESSIPYAFPLEGSNRLLEEPMVAQLDRMVLDTWAPDVQVMDGRAKSIFPARLGIGYCKMLIFTELQPNSKHPYDEYDVSPLLTEVAIRRISDLIADVMTPVRRSQSELNAETRPGLVLWLFYLSFVRKELPKLGRCQIFHDPALYEHVYKTLASLRTELKERFATDCKNKMPWAAGFLSQREVVRKTGAVESRILSVRLFLRARAGNSDYSSSLHPSIYDTSQSSGSNEGYNATSGCHPDMMSGLTTSEPPIESPKVIDTLGTAQCMQFEQNSTIIPNYWLDCKPYGASTAEAPSMHRFVGDVLSGGISLSRGAVAGHFGTAYSVSGFRDPGGRIDCVTGSSGEHCSSIYGDFVNEPIQMLPSGSDYSNLATITDFVTQPDTHTTNERRVDTHINTPLDSLRLLLGSTEIAANVWPLAVCDPVHEEPPNLHINDYEMPGLDFDQNVDRITNTSRSTLQHFCQECSGNHIRCGICIRCHVSLFRYF